MDMAPMVTERPLALSPNFSTAYGRHHRQQSAPQTRRRADLTAYFGKIAFRWKRPPFIHSQSFRQRRLSEQVRPAVQPLILADNFLRGTPSFGGRTMRQRLWPIKARYPPRRLPARKKAALDACEPQGSSRSSPSATASSSIRRANKAATLQINNV